MSLDQSGITGAGNMQPACTDLADFEWESIRMLASLPVLFAARGSAKAVDKPRDSGWALSLTLEAS